MPLLPILSVVFVGVVGGDKDDRVAQQVQMLLQEQDVKTLALAAPTVRKLARHAEGSRELVAALHADGLVGGELAGDARHRILRIAIYGAEGSLDTLFEIPFEGHRLSRDQVTTLGENFDDVRALVTKAQKPIAAAPPKPDKIVAPDVAPKAAVATRPVAKPAVAAKPVVAARPVAEPEPEPEPVVETPPAPVAVATADDDAVTADELIAATQVKQTISLKTEDRELRIGVGAGFGVGGRTFSPGPAAVPGYASSAIGLLHLDANVQPTRRTSVSVVAERSLHMTTPVTEGAMPTTFARWEATTGFVASHGRVDLELQGGLGRRTFAIESADPGRSPDNSYNYLILGASAGTTLGHHLTLRGHAAFEPVVSGTEPMEASFGEATRWAIAVGGSVELHPGAHLVVRAAADYQRFAWSWGMAGARGAGGAADQYPSAMLSVGAQY